MMLLSEVEEIRMILEYWEEEAQAGRQGIVILPNFALWIHHMMMKPSPNSPHEHFGKCLLTKQFQAFILNGSMHESCEC